MLCVDEIRPEMLKVLDIVRVLLLTHLFSVMWRLGTVPVEWQAGVVVPIFKKGDLRLCALRDATHQPPRDSRSVPGSPTLAPLIWGRHVAVRFASTGRAESLGWSHSSGGPCPRRKGR